MAQRSVMPDPYILQAPAGRAALIRGMGRMTRLLRVTLGPTAGTVAIAPLVSGRPPEILDSAATIARRMTGVGDPFEDMGAMIVRHLAWRVFEQVGDGVATSAVLAQALVERAETYLAAGGSPVPVKRGIERGLAVVLDVLERQARAIEEAEEVAALVAGIVHDPELAVRIGKIVEAVGPDGSIQIEDGERTETATEYIDGVRWTGGYASPYLLARGETTARLVNPRVLVTDHDIERAEHLLPALEACVAAGERALLIVAPEIRDSAIGLLALNRERGALDSAVVAKAPLFGAQRARVLEDLAVITGGRYLREEAHERLENVQLDDLGAARQAWVTATHFGIHGGRGDKAAIRARIGEARQELRATADDAWTRERIKERIGKLAGLAASIKVGAATTGERDALKLRVEAAVTTARAAMEGGAVPGGGAALLACVPAVDACARSLPGDEAIGAAILAHALAEPMRWLLRNAGLAPAPIVARARQDGPGCVFDVVRGEWVDPWEAGLVDPSPVVRAALETAVSAATLALTSDVLIHRREPPVSVQP
ncbi:MAG: chaperonin GroEL [Chloroflexi bacterium]|nr:chaperonin GroEL [Chloroflexota bacterium]